MLSTSAVTPLPDDSDRGVAADKLVTLLYDEVHRLAERLMSRQPANHTLQATELIHEVYLRIHDPSKAWGGNRAQLMAYAAQTMRNVLTDYARARRSRPRDPNGDSALDMVVVTYEDKVLDLLALDQALKKLAEIDATMARAVELRFFAGLPMSDVAELLGMSKRELERQWPVTRAWLYEAMS